MHIGLIFRWSDVGTMTWYQCMVMASKFGAMIFLPYSSNNPGWAGVHRVGGNAMKLDGSGGIWYSLQMVPIDSAGYDCVLARDLSATTNNLRPLNTILYDSNYWSYQDFGAQYYDVCTNLASTHGASIVTPWSLGLSSSKSYWIASTLTCSKSGIHLKI